MPAIITNKFRIHNSEQFRESFSEAAPNVYYLGIGRSQAWATLLRGDGRTDYEGSDTQPILPSDTVATEYNTFDDLLAVKKNYDYQCCFCYSKKKLDKRCYIRYLQTRLW